MNEEIKLQDPTYRQIAKYRAKAAEKAGVPTITLPTGLKIVAEDVLGKNFRGIRPPGSDKAYALHSADKYLRDPKPGCTYVWRKRNDEVTFGLVESGRLRPVRISRVRREVKGTQAIYAYAGPPEKSDDPESGQYAAFGTMALFEASPEATQEWYKDPALYDLSRLVTHKESIEAGIREAGAAHGVHVEHVEVTRKDVQSAEREKVSSPRPS